MIISVVNQKGGTGKTVTSINLACGLAEENKKTLLIDIDPQGNATTGLNCTVQPDQPTIKNILERGCEIEEAICFTKNSNLDLIPSTIKLSLTAERLYTQLFKESILTKAIKPVLNKYQYILVDCPPNLGVLTVNAVYLSDLIVVPCETSRASLDGISDLLNTIKLIKGNKFTNYRLLLTLFDSRNKTTNEIVLEELTSFKEKMFNTFINRNEALNQAQFAKQSIFDFDPNSKGATNYKELTKEVLSL